MFGSIAGAVGGVALDLYKDHQTMSHADFWNRQNIALQKEFAQNSIKWRVEDAKRAGVHPMAALGIQPASFSPVSSSINLSSNTGDYLANMGQNIDRAVLAAKTQEERDKAKAIAEKQSALGLRKQELENDLLQAQIDSLSQTRTTALPPSAPPSSPSKVNPLGGSDNAPRSPRGDYHYSSDPLLHLSRHGRTIFEYVDPDKADSITESQVKHLATMAGAEHEAPGLYLKVLNSKEISDRERGLIRQGKLELVRLPGVGWTLLDVDPPIRGVRGPARPGSGSGAFIRRF